MNDLRAALYCQLPAPSGNADDHRIELKEIAGARGWTVVASFSDQVNRTTGRSNTLGLDALFRAAARREFEVVAIWSLSQLGRTTRHVIDVVNALHDYGVDLYSHQDGIDTTTGSGKSAFASFVALGAFEREQIRQRARLSLDRARRNGTRLGRPSNLNDSVRAAIEALHGRGLSIRSIARQLKVGNSTVCKVLQAAIVHTPPQGASNFGNGIRTPLNPLEWHRNRVSA